MKLYIEQKFFSIWGRYSVYHENGDIAYYVQGYPALGKKMVIRDQNNVEVGMLKQELIHLLPTFQVWRKGKKVGYVSCKISFMRPRLVMNYKGWKVIGDVWNWNYNVKDERDKPVAGVHQKIWHITQHYEIHAENDADALDVLMLALAISALKTAQKKAAASSH